MLYDYSAANADTVAAETESAIARGDALIGSITGASERTWQTTMRPLDMIGVEIGAGYGRAAFLGRVHPDQDVRAAGIVSEERLSKWVADLVFNDRLYRAVAAYSETPEADLLTGEHRRFLDHWMRDFRRAGHDLAEDERRRVQELRRRLIELEVEFSRNLDEHEDHIEVTLDDLAGLPDSYVAGLRPGSSEGTYKVTLDYPDLFPFLRQADRRHLRRELAVKNASKAMNVNRPLLQEAVGLRLQLAEALGYASWAHYRTETKMAGSPDAVEQFYKELLPRLSERADGELAALQTLLDVDHPGEDLQVWDTAYYDTKQRKTDYGLDPEIVASYFPLERVLDGMLAITADVFGLEYHRVDSPTWHPDVTVYEIRNAGDKEAVAWFYMDLFPRDGKYGHAAAFDLVQAYRSADVDQRPVSAIVANFTKPSADRPSLLRHDEVSTFFHEFGHILHMSLTTAALARFSGAETEWDFVEAPSQIMEHWTWHPDVLRTFAKHHETGEEIPSDLVEQMVAARNLNKAMWTLRQIYLGKIDFGLHHTTRTPDVIEVEREAHALTRLPRPEGTCYAAGFGHLMGGYDAGYYGYLWSKVYGDDMFSVFEEHGVTSPDIGARYRREVLEPGGSRDAGDLVRGFLERDPSNAAFLRHIGLN